jgi:arylsulfatase
MPAEDQFGNRGIYHKGWTAVTRHKTPPLPVGEHVISPEEAVRIAMARQ